MLNYKSARGYTGWGQLAILCSFVGAGLIVTAIVQLIIGSSLISSDIPFTQSGPAMMKALFKPENIMYLQLSQVLGTFFLMFLPVVFYVLLCHGKSPLWIGFSRRLSPAQVFLGFLIIYCANIAANPLADLSKYLFAHFPHLNKWAQSLEDDYSSMVMAMSGLKSYSALVIAIIIMAFFPAMFEEMLFRGAIQNLLVRWWKKPVLAVVVTSLLFSLIHGSAYLFVSRAILGFVLGWMYYRSKNLWINIIAHFLNNAVAVIQLFLMARSTAKPDMAKLDERMPMWLELASIPILYGLFVAFDKLSANKRAKIELEEQQLWIKSTPQYNLADTQN